MLENCTSYKDKVANGITPNSGLFTYPVLMAADILIYDSDLVPVGRDQKQHLEVTRDIAVKMNLAYGEGLLKIPQARIREESAVVLGTDGRKMSKSYDNTIGLFEEEKPFKKKFRGILTDSTPMEAPKPIEGSSILALYRLVATPEEVATMEQEHLAGGVGYGAFKTRLGDKMWDFLAEAREKRATIVADKGYVDDVLQAGAAKARALAKKTVERVRSAVGLG
jgi:tryptophanyl-tRNA synthetase